MSVRVPRLIRVIVAIGVTLVALVVVLRVLRHNTSPPETVGTRVYRERNLFSDLYAARLGDGSVVLFDAGLDDGGGALDRLLAALGKTRDDVRDVLLTHGHFDHVSASPLCRHARIRVGAPDVDFLAHRAPVQAPIAGKLLNAIWPAPAIQASALNGVTRILLDKGDEVLAIPTPGHTAGSYIFVFDGTLFAGDSLTIDGEKLDFAMAPFSVDEAENRRSIAALGDALAHVVVHTVCTGHQGCTQPGRGAGMLAALVERAKAEAK